MLGALLRRLRGEPAPGAAFAFFSPDDLPAGNTEPTPVRACVLIGEGDVRGAQRVLEASGSPLATALLAALLEQRGEAAASERALQAVIAAERDKPAEASLAQHFYSRGVHYLNQALPQSAERCLALAQRLKPEAPGPAERLGNIGWRTGDTDAGERWYGIALANTRAEERGALRVKALLDTLPQIYASKDAIEASRQRFEREIDALIEAPPRVASYESLINTTPFYLSYQGRSDHALLGKLAVLLSMACPSLAWRAPHLDDAPATGRPLRVAFVSAFLSGHSVGSWYAGLVRRLIESGRFEIGLFTMHDVEPRLAEVARLKATHVPLDKSLERAREQVASFRPDVVVHTDAQLHPRIYALAFSRLARVQCVLVGHPSSTGLPALDWFVSNVHQDRPHAQAHYSERLALLARIPAWVERTAPPSSWLSREELGLASGRRYYAVPMKLQKIHPDFDAAMGAILEQDGDAQLLLFEDPDKPLWRAQLEARFARTLPGVAKRIVFRPFAKRDVFLSLLREADCVMDTFHFSGGVTTYTAFSVGVPVLSLPGQLFRSRMTAGMYAQAGIDAVLASDDRDFVTRALAWAREPDLRRSLGRRIEDAQAALFEDAAGVDGFADWLEATGRGA